MPTLRRSLAVIFALTSLSAAAPDKDGFVPLFDGKTLDGWQKLKGGTITGWTAVDGTLHYDPARATTGGNNIYTVKEYANFILELEWKITPKGNSGIKYRMNWYDGQYLGPEYQALGDAGRDKATVGKAKGATASLYDLIPPDPAAWNPKPHGQWNRTKIVADPVNNTRMSQDC